MRHAAWVLAACVLTGCGEGYDRLGREGDPCRALNEVCADDEHLLVCVDERWTVSSCDELCKQKAPGVGADGCDAVNAIEGHCVCVPPPDGCTPGEASCIDAEQLQVCDAAWAWTIASCESICAANPAQTVSLGCELDDETGAAACSCTAIGTTCTTEAPVCLDDDKLANCDSGVWTAVECNELCPDAANCQPAVGGASCICAP